ncbi:MAG TPA: hypothetical protein DEW46_16125 [Verrucomicrobia bacterium]|jgi:hypothetical protein|nr:hypothetical protein [Verrucomicrobiota bacterium]
MVAAIMIGSLLAGTGIAQNPSTPTGGPAGGGEPSNSTGGGAGELEPPDLSRAVAIDSPVFREIERTVEKLRGLKFKEPVEYLTLERSDLKAILEEEIFKVYSKEELRIEGLAFEHLGFIPEGAGADLATMYLSLLEEQIGAFYEPVSNRLVTLDANAYEGAINRMLLAHELTHALEDQHYRLEELPLNEKGNDDKILAISCALEGSATRLMDAFFTQDPLTETVSLEELTSVGGGGYKQIAQAPLYMREMLTFPYLGGRKFTDDLVGFGGIRLLNHTLENPPTTTEQVLHPEKYYPIPEVPMAVPPGLDPFEDKEVELLVENCAGELGMRLFFTHHLNAFQAIGPAMGWNGDRWYFYRFPNTGSSPAYGWAWWSAWDSPAEADEFLKGYRKALTAWKGDAVRFEESATQEGAWNNARGDGWVLEVQRLDEIQVLLRLQPSE